MNKKEYLKNLKDSLSVLPEEESKKHVRTYRVKINTLINSGLTEEEALKKLGTPSKVANSIIKGKDKKKSTKSKNVTKKNSSVKTSKSKTKKESKETLEQKKDRVKKLLDETLNEIKKSSKKEKVENKSKKEKKTKETKKLEEPIIEEVLEDTQEEIIEDIQEEIIEKKKETFKEEEKVVITEDDNIKTSKLVIKQMTNLGCLILALVMLYYPFNLLNVYAIKAISTFGLNIGYIYAFGGLLYLFYLVICVVSLFYYLEYITKNKKIKQFNVVSQKIKRISLYILVVPSMLLVVGLTILFIMSCFFYLDGLKIKGIPVACLGLLIFGGILYTTLRNKILRKEKSIFYSFFLYLVPIIIIGIGLGSVYHDVKDYDFILDVDSKYSMKTVEFEYDIPEAEDFKIYFNTNYGTAPTYKVDKKLKNKVKIEITYYKDYYELNNLYDSTSTYISLGASNRRKLAIFLENIKDNRIYSMDELERYEVVIYTNEKDANRVVVES